MFLPLRQRLAQHFAAEFRSGLRQLAVGVAERAARLVEQFHHRVQPRPDTQRRGQQR